MSALVVAVLGAESTGKTTLAMELAARLADEGLMAEVLPETLRLFCDREGRTPLPHEQWDIAREHSLRIEAAALGADVVLADTTALMTAVYSEFVFGDRSLYPWALRVQQRCDLNLLTALDLPWQADGIQRDGPHVREPVDALVRAALQRGGFAYAVVAGQGGARLDAAWGAVRHALQRRAHGAPRPTWQWRCLDCDEPQCESHLFRLS